MRANNACAEVKRDHPEYFRIEQQGDKRVLVVDRAYVKAMRDILVTDFNYFNTVKNMIACCIEMGDERKARELQEHVDNCTPINADIIGPFR